MSTNTQLSAAGQFRKKLSSLSAGVALGAGMLLLGTGCATSGQCASCGACATGFPILAAPILLDGAIILVGKAKTKVKKTAS